MEVYCKHCKADERMLEKVRISREGMIYLCNTCSKYSVFPIEEQDNDRDNREEKSKG
jgi:hypothetical protein